MVSNPLKISCEMLILINTLITETDFRNNIPGSLLIIEHCKMENFVLRTFQCVHFT